jgi:hypothetical protein
MAFELWDLRSRNLIVDFETAAEAVAAVRAYIDAHDDDDLVLIELEDSDRPERSLTGSELRAWAKDVGDDQRRSA